MSDFYLFSVSGCGSQVILNSLLLVGIGTSVLGRYRGWRDAKLYLGEQSVVLGTKKEKKEPLGKSLQNLSHNHSIFTIRESDISKSANTFHLYIPSNTPPPQETPKAAI
jgi:hypothetical protein